MNSKNNGKGKLAEKKIDETLSKFNVNKYLDYHPVHVVMTSSKKDCFNIRRSYYLSSGTLNTNSSKLMSETLSNT